MHNNAIQQQKKESDFLNAMNFRHTNTCLPPLSAERVNNYFTSSEVSRSLENQ